MVHQSKLSEILSLVQLIHLTNIVQIKENSFPIDSIVVAVQLKYIKYLLFFTIHSLEYDKRSRFYEIHSIGSVSLELSCEYDSDDNIS